MRKTTERKTVLTVGEKVTRVNIIEGGNAVEIFSIPELKSEKTQPQAGTKEFEEMFPIVDIEGVSLQDTFMLYMPKTNLAKRVKASIIKAKKIKMKNFRIPAMDPSLADDGETIIYCAGEKPAVFKSVHWWVENAANFMPEKNSRLRDDLEHDVFLGVLIKYLVEEKMYEVRKAWETVCVDSKEIGHYSDSKDSKHNFERTGSRPIGKWFDLGNTCKIVKKGDASFVIFGGRYCTDGKIAPLADFADGIVSYDNDLSFCVGALRIDV